MSDRLLWRLRNPPFGTETSERNLFGDAADEIERLRKALSNAVFALETLAIRCPEVEGVLAICRPALPLSQAEGR